MYIYVYVYNYIYIDTYHTENMRAYCAVICSDCSLLILLHLASFNDIQLPGFQPPWYWFNHYVLNILNILIDMRMNPTQ